MSINQYILSLILSLMLTGIIASYFQVETTNTILLGILLSMCYIFLTEFVVGDVCLTKPIWNLLEIYYNTDNTLQTTDTNRMIGQPSQQNQLYYNLTQAYYPMNNRNQINVKDCTITGECLIPEDSTNLYPVRRTLSEVLPTPHIGQKEKESMLKLNPGVAPETPMPVNSNSDGTDVAEQFGLFEDYRMAEFDKPLYYNAPDKDNNMCKNCLVGHCDGDLCSVIPYQSFKREDPLNM